MTNSEKLFIESSSVDEKTHFNVVVVLRRIYFLFKENKKKINFNFDKSRFKKMKKICPSYVWPLDMFRAI